MADIRKIRIMISSRSEVAVFGGTPLCEVRKRLRTFLHTIRWQGVQILPDANQIEGKVGRDQSLFDVWIHEDDIGRTADTSTLEMSLKEINRADVIVVLYTGEAGSANGNSEIGICHAELKEALDRRSELVVVFALAPLSTSATPRDETFRKYVKEQAVPQVEVESEANLQGKVAEALQERIAQLVRRGGSVGSRKRDRGAALDWNRLDMTARSEAMRRALIESLAAEELPKAKGQNDSLHRVTLLGEKSVAVRIDAIPAALSVASARERVGQPFMLDHRHAQTLVDSKLSGVVHVIACHRGVTESQATKMLGTPDAMSVPSDFGVYAADHVQKIQIVFLSQCSDETAVALAVRRFREWLVQSKEEKRIVERAQSRGRILRAVAGEQS